MTKRTTHKAKTPGVQAEGFQVAKKSNLKLKFTGTDNPRHLRAIAALLRRPISRQELDSVAGCANGPDLIYELRHRGLDINCSRIEVPDRDGKVCRPGVYSLTPQGRRAFWNWRRCSYTNGRVHVERPQ